MLLNVAPPRLSTVAAHLACTILRWRGHAPLPAASRLPPGGGIDDLDRLIAVDFPVLEQLFCQRSDGPPHVPPAYQCRRAIPKRVDEIFQVLTAGEVGCRH